MPTVDLAYLIRLGETILEHRTVFPSDVLSAWTLGRPWLNQQWAFELAVAVTFRGAGWLGLAALRALLIAGILTLGFLACRAAGAGRRMGALLTIAAFTLMTLEVNLRSQLAGMVCFAAVLWIVEDRHRHPGRLWGAPLIVLMWANVHGSFFLGPLPLALAWLEDLLGGSPSRQRTLLVLVASLAATVATPFGPDTWRYVLRVAGSPQVRDVVYEWQPTSVRLPIGVIFFASLVPMLLLAGRQARRGDRVAILRLLLFALVALSSYRGTLWWALVAPVTAARWLPEIRPNAPDPQNRANLVIAALIIGLIP